MSKINNDSCNNASCKNNNKNKCENNEYTQNKGENAEYTQNGHYDKNCCQGGYKVAVAKSLLDIGAVYLRPLEPFVWASGILSPIYCDNRLVLSNICARNTVEETLCLLIKKNFPEATFVAGTATAGIAHAAIVADRLRLPCGYVRTKAKEHGRQNRIEGKISQNDKVVVVEDLISTGGSVLDAVSCIAEQGAQVLGVVSIFTYNMASAREKFSQAGFVYHSATDFETVIKEASDRGQFSADKIEALLAFRNNPQDDSWRNMF